MGLRLLHIPKNIYKHFIELIVRHIVFVYAVEIMLIAISVVFGIISENGFMACGS